MVVWISENNIEIWIKKSRNRKLQAPQDAWELYATKLEDIFQNKEYKIE